MSELGEIRKDVVGKSIDDRYMVIENRLTEIFKENKVLFPVTQNLIQFVDDHVMLYGINDRVFLEENPYRTFKMVADETIKFFDFLSNVDNDQISKITFTSKTGEKVTLTDNIYIDMIMDSIPSELYDFGRPFLKNRDYVENDPAGRKVSLRTSVIKGIIDQIIKTIPDSDINTLVLIQRRYLALNILSMLGISKGLPFGCYANHDFNNLTVGKHNIFRGTCLEKDDSIPQNSCKKS